MKTFKLLILFCTGIFCTSTIFAQANAFINVLTQNSGLVNLGGTVDIEVTVGNTGPVSSIGINKVRAQISVPSAIVSVLPNAQQAGLPAGWTILSNSGSVITVCNGSDIIPVGEQRTILVKVQGNALGGPSTILGQLTFGPGTGVCTGPGTLPGDNTSDNSSSSTIQVAVITPLTLIDFNAKMINCEPVLNWITETEINTDRFEIERGSANNQDWRSIGIVAAKGNTSARYEYNFTDKSLDASSEQVLYRLKMIDKDGNYKYTEAVRVFTNCKTIRAYVYPNPVQNGKLYISLTGTSGYTEASLVSLSGQLIATSRMTNGNSYINTSNVAAGIYVLNIKGTNGLDKKVKVFIQNR